MIHVEELVKRCKTAKQNAVDGISGEIASGEFFALLEPGGEAVHAPVPRGQHARRVCRGPSLER